MTHEMKMPPYDFIPVVAVDDTPHTLEHPFCSESACFCHSDTDAIAHIQQDYEAGLFTAEEVILTLLGGKTLS